MQPPLSYDEVSQMLLGIAQRRAQSALGCGALWGIASIVLNVCSASDFLCGVAWSLTAWQGAAVLIALRDVRQITRYREARRACVEETP
jgi:hypothetical protein